LNALCVDLLRRDPADRPTESAVLERFGTRVDRIAPSGTRTSRIREVPFVGRDEELAALRDAYQTMRRGSPVLVHVYGSYGAGKSALVQRFLHEIDRVSETVILKGRLREQK
jgi:hypothetical protein